MFGATTNMIRPWRDLSFVLLLFFLLTFTIGGKRRGVGTAQFRPQSPRMKVHDTKREAMELRNYAEEKKRGRETDRRGTHGSSSFPSSSPPYIERQSRWLWLTGTGFAKRDVQKKILKFSEESLTVWPFLLQSVGESLPNNTGEVYGTLRLCRLDSSAAYTCVERIDLFGSERRAPIMEGEYPFPPFWEQPKTRYLPSP